MTKKNPDFEQTLSEISQLVNKMEQGNLPLEDSLKNFEKGVKLIHHCQQSLNQAEQTVKILTKDSQKLEDFDNDRED